MREKSKRILGLICLIFAGLSLIGEVSILTIPTMAKMANKSIGDHILSLLEVFGIGAVGLHLRRAKTGDSSAFVLRLIVFALFLTPLLNLQVASKLIQEYGLFASLSQVRQILMAMSLLFIIVPYIFGKRFILYQSKLVTHSSYATPESVLYIIGLACVFLPSTASSFSVLVGLPECDMYYFSGISYVAALVWSIWWYYRYYATTK
jgi:hypothetical protein